ncbi:MAG: IS21 family transposase [Pseudomonadales bacterium]
MAMLAKIRRMYFRDKLSLREIARQTGLSRNTIRHWLRDEGAVEPRYPKRDPQPAGRLDPYKGQLDSWLRTDSHRPKRDRRTAKALFLLLQACGYRGSYSRVALYIKQWRMSDASPSRKAFVPMRFAPGEAFQFDWSCEYAVIGGVRKRLEVAHAKLTHSRVFWLVAYPTQSHEMLFDAHARAFAAFGGVPKRGIYDNMKTAVDKVGNGKERTVNARFQAMCSHYLFEPDFCNRAAGWEKGVVEKNVQDRRRQIWHAVLQRHWNSLAELNAWVAQECRAAQQDMRHPDWPDMTLLEVLEHEQPHLMPSPKPFDGYVEHPARVTGTALIHVQRNRYSVPVEYAHKVVSVRVYPEELVIVHDDNIIARLPRCFDRHQTFYDWQHYIPVIQRKPGALRNGAPFNDMPLPLIQLQKHLLKREGGDRVMAQVLAVVPEHGVEAVVVAVELALESGRPSAEHVLNVLARLKQPLSLPESITGNWLLQEAPQANVERYDLWRSPLDAREVNHVD